jgi:hypothetical protein
MAYINFFDIKVNTILISNTHPERLAACLLPHIKINQSKTENKKTKKKKTIALLDLRHLLYLDLLV